MGGGITVVLKKHRRKRLLPIYADNFMRIGNAQQWALVPDMQARRTYGIKERNATKSMESIPLQVVLELVMFSMEEVS